MSGQPVRVFLAGERANELGGFAGHPSYREANRPGVIAALLMRVEADGWEVAGAVEWKRIRKFRVGRAEHADSHYVMGAANDAREAGCEVLAFTRDRDGEKQRPAAIEAGIARVSAQMPTVRVLGGCACPTLEGWLLALRGTRQTESMSVSKASAELVRAGVASKDGAAMAALVEQANLDEIAADAQALIQWLTQARTNLIVRREAP